MDRIFKPGPLFQVPDGTWLSPFLNSKDSESDLPFDLIDGFSIASGKIDAGSNSKIHIFPHVTQATYVLNGTLTARMKDNDNDAMYELELKEYQAIVSKPGSFFQLVNETDLPCMVLYIVSPAYLFLMENNEVLYGDALSLDEDWDTLAQNNWTVPALNNLPTQEDRDVAYIKLKEMKAG